MSDLKRCHKKFEPRLRAWKLKDEKTCEEYIDMARDTRRVEEKGWQQLGVDEQWQQMKHIMMETRENICGKSEAPYRHEKLDGGMMRLLRRCTETG